MWPFCTDEFPRGHEAWARVLELEEAEDRLIVRCRGYFPPGTEEVSYYLPEPDETRTHWPLSVASHRVDRGGVHTLVLLKSNNDLDEVFAARRPAILTSCGNLQRACPRSPRSPRRSASSTGAGARGRTSGPSCPSSSPCRRPTTSRRGWGWGAEGEVSGN